MILKRSLALVIDWIILSFTFGWRLALYLGDDIVISRSLAVVSLFAFCAFYSFLCDRFWNGCSIGKWLMGIRTSVPSEKRELYCCTHGILRYLAVLLSPITVIYIFVKKRLPYDSWYQSSVEKIR